MNTPSTSDELAVLASAVVEQMVIKGKTEAATVIKVAMDRLGVKPESVNENEVVQVAQSYYDRFHRPQTDQQ